MEEGLSSSTGERSRHEHNLAMSMALFQLAIRLSNSSEGIDAGNRPASESQSRDSQVCYNMHIEFSATILLENDMTGTKSGSTQM
jgi:hypothetical protein